MLKAQICYPIIRILLNYHTRMGKVIFDKAGFAGNGLYVAGFAWSPVYVLASRTPVIFEAGFYCMGRIYERDIRSIGKEGEPKLLFLTHVHYDHCGAAAYFKKIFPGLEIIASHRAAEIIDRPNARALMLKLSDNVTGIIDGMEGIDTSLLIRDPFQSFVVDRVVGDGAIVPLGDGLSVQIFSCPGHTRDMLSYYVPERKILIATEAVGCLSHGGNIVTEFLVDYDGYIRSLKRLSDLDIEVLCQGHHFVFTGDDVKQHLARSLRSAEAFREKVEKLLSTEEGSVDRVVQWVKAEEYDTNSGTKQPEAAYLINLRTRIHHLAERLKG